MKNKRSFLYSLHAILFLSLSCFTQFAFSQQDTISVCVLDAETKQPIDIVVARSSVEYTITNMDGEFELKAMPDDKIKLSHISYNTKTIDRQALKDTIFMQPKVYQLGEIIVVPREVIIRELTAVWKKYYALLKNKKEKDFPKRTFYYRQLTQSNDEYTEYIESFFTAPTTVGVRTMSLQEGRFARAKKDSTGLFTNFFYYSQITPLQTSKAKFKNSCNAFLIKDFDKYYDLHIMRIISPDSEDEVKVYQFTPYQETVKVKKNGIFSSGKLYYGVFPSGQLYIRTKDLAIVHMEVSIPYIGLYGFPNVKSERYSIIVTYQDGIESYPVVETVKGNANISYIPNGVERNLKVNSVLFATDYKFDSKGKKLKQKDFLLDKVARTEYDQAFWDNNPIVKRTKVEQQVLEDFNSHGYWGTIDLEGK